MQRLRMVASWNGSDCACRTRMQADRVPVRMSAAGAHAEATTVALGTEQKWRRNRPSANFCRRYTGTCRTFPAGDLRLRSSRRELLEASGA